MRNAKQNDNQRLLWCNSIISRNRTLANSFQCYDVFRTRKMDERDINQVFIEHDTWPQEAYQSRYVKKQFSSSCLLNITIYVPLAWNDESSPSRSVWRNTSWRTINEISICTPLFDINGITPFSMWVTQIWTRKERLQRFNRRLSKDQNFRHHLCFLLPTNKENEHETRTQDWSSTFQ